jgi:hypothetical protein
LLYGSETWTVKPKDTDPKQNSGNRNEILKISTDCIRTDCIRNEYVRRELHTDSVHQIESYRQKWINHLDRMSVDRTPTQVLNTNPEDVETKEDHGKVGMS